VNRYKSLQRPLVVALAGLQRGIEIDVVVLAGRDQQIARRSERKTVDRLSVDAERQPTFAARHIPQPDPALPRRRGRASHVQVGRDLVVACAGYQADCFRHRRQGCPDRGAEPSTSADDVHHSLSVSRLTLCKPNVTQRLTIRGAEKEHFHAVPGYLLEFPAVLLFTGSV